MEHNLLYPDKIVFGTDCLLDLTQILPENAAVLLVTGKSALKNGLADRLRILLKDFKVIDACGIAVPEPPLECVDKLITLGREGGATAVVGAGGGSAIDTAKAAAAIIPAGGMTADYFSEKREITEKGLFFAAVPTTAGTGAEITKNSVLTDSENKVKKSIRSPFMVPDAAIVDPVLTLDLPPSVTAASGMDAFTQALESFTSSSANDVTKPLAKSAVAAIFANIRDVYRNGKDLEKRKAMAEASLMSAMAFSQSGLGAVHGLAHPVGSLLNVPHGVACSILLTPVMEWNASECTEEYAELARAVLDPEAAALDDIALTHLFIADVSRLCRDLDIPANFADYGLKEEHFPFIVRNCRSRSMECNPRPMSDEDVTDILLKLI